MTKTSRTIGGVIVAGVVLWTSALALTGQATSGPSFTEAGELRKPADFREWVFLSAGLGMTYSPPVATANPATRSPSFINVYVGPSSYRQFLQTGVWPDKTMFVLEIRGSESEGSINLGGRYQSKLRAIEVEVKDRTLPGGWAYYDFGARGETAAALPRTAPCYECHGAKAAVEHTFVQFYPTLMDVARRLGTVNQSYGETASPHP